MDDSFVIAFSLMTVLISIISGLLEKRQIQPDKIEPYQAQD